MGRHCGTRAHGVPSPCARHPCPACPIGRSGCPYRESSSRVLPTLAVLGDWHGRPMPGAALVVDDDGDKMPTFTARGSTITD